MRMELTMYKDKSIIDVIDDSTGRLVDRLETTALVVKDFHQYDSSLADPDGTLPVAAKRVD